MESLYWHDYETWGVNPAYDRPAQFAGIRTDMELNIVGEPLVIYCKPADDVLPHPEACLVTGITPQLALEKGLPEYQFIEQIHRELAKPKTCGVGYNSIRFDDEVTRYTLYRNFYDAYAREWQRGNSRWDLIDLVRCCRALRPEGIEWPEREDGTPSFKLEELTVANGISHESAHDALSDVHATIAVARLIKERQPKLYDYAFSLRKKQNVAKLLDLQQKKPVLHTSGRIPAARFCTTMMMPLAKHPTNGNAVICYDLAVNPEPLLNLSAEEVAGRVFVSQEELGDGVARIPLKAIHLNRSSMVMTTKLLNDEVAERIQLDPAQCWDHYQRLLQVSDLEAKVQAAFGSQTFEDRTDPDAALYGGGFFSDADKQLMDSVRLSTTQELAESSFPFEDERLPELLFRYRARNFPDSLSGEERALWEEFRRAALTDPSHPSGICLEELYRRIEQLSQGAGDSQRAVLAALKSYADGILSEA